MKKISTVAIEGMQIFKPNQLTIGLDLGDRTSRYCILNEAGEVILEQELPTTPKGFEQVFSKIPRSRIALETGTHSPWVSRQFAHEVIVAHAQTLSKDCGWKDGDRGGSVNKVRIHRKKTQNRLDSDWPSHGRHKGQIRLVLSIDFIHQSAMIEVDSTDVEPG